MTAGHHRDLRNPRLHVGPPRLAVALALAGLLAACQSGATTAPSGASTPGGSVAASSTTTVVTVAITPAGCPPDTASIPAGPVTFKIVNNGADGVTELELEKDGKILGEKENLAPGLSGSFSLDLVPGEYVISCPGAGTPDAPLHVTAAGAAATTSTVTAQLARATAAYAVYIKDQVGRLVTATQAFTDAVIAGDVARAKTLYGAARVFYERIEPVAESFGDLDPAIDGREDDASTAADFTGFHRLEHALWVTGSVTGMAPIATRLLADVKRLQVLVTGETYQPAQLANGAAELLDEISASKITGEEERYSHLDLLDVQANLDGSRGAYELLKPALQDVDATLVARIDAGFVTVQAALEPYRSGDSFVSYTTLSQAQTRALAQVVDALAESMSLVATRLVGA